MKWETSTDGAWVHGSHLYVSKVMFSEMIVINLPSEKVIERWRAPPQVEWLDDFSILDDGVVYASSFRSGAVVRFRAQRGAPGEVVVAGLKNPTSVRPVSTCYPPNPSALVVTEGGSLLTSTRDRSVYLLNL